jgi:ubiquinone/menaquinone biosynthesis C-methylase UbiE
VTGEGGHSGAGNAPHCRGLRKRLQALLLAHCAGGYERMVADRKRALFADLRGTVLEIGPGTGANFRYFPPDIRWIGVEPNPYMHPFVRREAARQGLGIDLRLGTAERLDVPDGSVDAAVGTLVLCSIEDPDAALREIVRVLRPGGRFLYIEHVAAPSGTRLRRIQRLVRPLWKVFGDGCRPDRETWAALERAGFARVRFERFTVPVPVVGPQIAGEAVKQE